MTNSQYIAALKQERDLAIQYRADKIAELENKIKHLNQVVYNTAKVAFEAGTCCPDVNVYQSGILFAKKLIKEQVK